MRSACGTSLTNWMLLTTTNRRCIRNNVEYNRVIIIDLSRYDEVKARCLRSRVASRPRPISDTSELALASDSERGAASAVSIFYSNVPPSWTRARRLIASAGSKIVDSPTSRSGSRSSKVKLKVTEAGRQRGGRSPFVSLFVPAHRAKGGFRREWHIRPEIIIVRASASSVFPQASRSRVRARARYYTTRRLRNVAVCDPLPFRPF